MDDCLGKGCAVYTHDGYLLTAPRRSLDIWMRRAIVVGAGASGSASCLLRCHSNVFLSCVFVADGCVAFLFSVFSCGIGGVCEVLVVRNVRARAWKQSALSAGFWFRR